MVGERSYQQQRARDHVDRMARRLGALALVLSGGLAGVGIVAIFLWVRS